MRTPAEDAALSAFIDAATSDADPGNPLAVPSSPGRKLRRPTASSGATCMKADQPSSSEQATSMLIEPVQLGRFACLRNEVLQRITVEISYRRKEAPPAPDIPRFGRTSGDTHLNA